MDAFGLGLGFGLYGLWELTGWLLDFPGVMVLILAAIVLSDMDRSTHG
jgi:hypothetical protein